MSFPYLPITNLESAEFTNTIAAFRGENTVIDFWTTRCTNCPTALNELNALAGDERYQNVRFASICCDSCDGARNIIDSDDIPRWNKISHYFMDHDNKEKAKSILGFKQVPFIVVLNKNGDIVQMGPKKKIDFGDIPGMVTESKTDMSGGERSFVLDEDF
mmetsp:Transcript_2660/g.6074  ORF Transcript_2660/g.6074 Transcript_2660/m.6074 type:complete len:160 (-) Transcript_2660:253-732(-)